MKVILDLESDALLPDCTKIHCVVAKIFGTDEVFTFVQEEVYSQEFTRFLDKVELLIGQNIVSFDIKVFEKLLGYFFPVDKCRDSLIMSRLCSPVREGGHSLEAWGNRFGLVKPPIEDFSVYTPEMLQRCREDVRITERFYRYLLQKEITSVSKEALLCEQQVRYIIDEQIKDGVYIDRQKVQTLNVRCKKRADEIQEEVRKSFPVRSKSIKTISPRLRKDGSGRLLFIRLGSF